MSDVSMPPGRSLSIIDRAIKARLDAYAQELGLTAVQLRVLGTLSHLEDSGVEEVNQRDLERVERVTHPTMTALIQRLELKGFVTCSQSTKDHRFKRISCTEKSANLYRELAALDEKVMRELCSELTAEEAATLKVAIDKIVRHILRDSNT